MATSIQVVGEQAEAFNDLDLLFLLRLMVEEMQANPSRYSSLPASCWKECCSNYGPGVIDLELDAIASASAAKSEFMQLLSTLEHNLDALGKVVPADTMNARWGILGVQFHDYSTLNLHTAIDKLRELLRSV